MPHGHRVEADGLFLQEQECKRVNMQKHLSFSCELNLNSQISSPRPEHAGSGF
jgi:hypothetical protein